VAGVRTLARAEVKTQQCCVSTLNATRNGALRAFARRAGEELPQRLKPDVDDSYRRHKCLLHPVAPKLLSEQFQENSLMRHCDAIHSRDPLELPRLRWDFACGLRRPQNGSTSTPTRSPSQAQGRSWSVRMTGVKRLGDRWITRDRVIVKSSTADQRG
jgi:hypothetical protein